MTQTVSLRAPEPSDLDFLYTLETAQCCGDGAYATAPVSRQMLWEYLQTYSADIFAQRQLRLIVSDGDTAIGTADLYDFDPRDRRAYIGIGIAAAYRRQGYGRQAIEAVCRYASQLGLHQLAAIVPIDNDASMALFHASGFRPAGRLRSWVRRGNTYTDAIVFQRLFA